MLGMNRLTQSPFTLETGQFRILSYFVFEGPGSLLNDIGSILEESLLIDRHSDPRDDVLHLGC